MQIGLCKIMNLITTSGTMAVAEKCIRCSICNSEIAVKQCRLLNPCKPSNEDVRSFYGDFVNPTFKSVRPDDAYYVCKKDFQLLVKAMKARNTYQAIVREMKLAIGVTIDVSTKGIDDSLSESSMSIGDTESSSLSGISKLPEGEASPSVTSEAERTTAVFTLGRRKLPPGKSSGEPLTKRRRLSQPKKAKTSTTLTPFNPLRQQRTPQSLLKVVKLLSDQIMIIPI